MRIGISPYGTSRAAALELAVAAVAGGIDTLWLGDGLFRRPDFAGWQGGLESMTELAYFAGCHPGTQDRDHGCGAARAGYRLAGP